jgi:hypothetical protein
MTQIIIIIKVVQITTVSMHSILPLQRTSVQCPTQPPFLFTTYKYQFTQADGQTQPNSSSHQPNQATDMISAVLLRSLGLRFEFGRPERKYPAGGVMHEVSKGKREMEAVDGVDCRGESLAHALTQCDQDQIRFQIPDAMRLPGRYYTSSNGVIKRKTNLQFNSRHSPGVCLGEMPKFAGPASVQWRRCASSNYSIYGRAVPK